MIGYFRNIISAKLCEFNLNQVIIIVFFSVNEGKCMGMTIITAYSVFN